MRLLKATFLICGLSGVPVYAAPATASPAKTTEVRLCVPKGNEDLLNFVLLVAQDKGFFAAQDLKVKMHVLTGDKKDRKTIDTLAGPYLQSKSEDWGLADKASECDLGTSSVAQALISNEIAAPLMPIYMSTYGQDYDTHIVVAKDSPIKTVKDLKGKKIRIGQIPTHMALYKLLKENGLAMTDVVIKDHLAPNRVAGMLRSGELDAAITYVPSMPLMLASGDFRVLSRNIIGQYVMPATPNAMLMLNRAFASTHPEAVAKVTKALRATMAYVDKNPTSIIYSAEAFLAQHRHLKKKTSPAVAERAVAFMSKLNLLDLQDAKQSATAQKEVTQFQEMLVQFRYLKTPQNLTQWFHADARQASAQSSSDVSHQ
jgi:ABC-type nitrate/sulfonate/bicarbonate transport system substrate-binding protein